jgi:hypothetical protein
MKAYDDLFAAPIPFAVLSAIAALVDRELPREVGPTPMPIATPPLGGQVAV